MMKIYRSTLERELETLESFGKGSWVNLVNPTKEEIDQVSEQLGIDREAIIAPLDLEESPRMEIEDEFMLIIVDIPILEESEQEGQNSYFTTIPLGVIIAENYIITTCSEETNILKLFEENRIKSFFTFKKNRFLLQILYRMAAKYLTYLKQIDRRSSRIQRQLHKSTRNRELIQLFDLENSLIYFSTSLKANEMALEKLLKTESIRKYPEDQDLLEDVIIEGKQAIEMTNIYSRILSGTMDTYASVISNNQNTVMKFLAIITLGISIPNIITSFYGMNIALPLQDNPYAYLIIGGISVALVLGITVALTKKNPF